MMKIRILLAVCGMLIVLCFVQWSTLRAMQVHLREADAYQAEIAHVGERPDEVERFMAWLDAFLRAPEGLSRSSALCVDSALRPEIVATTLGIYLRERARGANEVEARQQVSEILRGNSAIGTAQPPPR